MYKNILFTERFKFEEHLHKLDYNFTLTNLHSVRRFILLLITTFYEIFSFNPVPTFGLPLVGVNFLYFSSHKVP